MANIFVFLNARSLRSLTWSRRIATEWEKADCNRAKEDIVW